MANRKSKTIELQIFSKSLGAFDEKLVDNIPIEQFSQLVSEVMKIVTSMNQTEFRNLKEDIKEDGTFDDTHLPF